VFFFSKLESFGLFIYVESVNVIVESRRGNEKQSVEIIETYEMRVNCAKIII